MKGSHVKIAIAALLFTAFIVFSVLEKVISLYCQLRFPFIVELTPFYDALIPVLGITGMHIFGIFITSMFGLSLLSIVYFSETTSMATKVGRPINLVYLTVYGCLAMLTVQMINVFINNFTIMTRWI